MGALFALAFAALGMVGLMFFMIILSTLMGGVVGWTVEMFFPFVTATLNQLGHLNLTGFEMGACLGFFGSFFRSSNTNKCEK